MAAHDSIKQITFRPLGGGTDRASLEIALESGAAIQKEIPSNAFMRAVADILKYEKALQPQMDTAPATTSRSDAGRANQHEVGGA